MADRKSSILRRVTGQGAGGQAFPNIDWKPTNGSQQVPIGFGPGNGNQQVPIGFGPGNGSPRKPTAGQRGQLGTGPEAGGHQRETIPAHETTQSQRRIAEPMPMVARSSTGAGATQQKYVTKTPNPGPAKLEYNSDGTVARVPLASSTAYGDMSRLQSLQPQTTLRQTTEGIVERMPAPSSTAYGDMSGLRTMAPLVEDAPIIVRRPSGDVVRRTSDGSIRRRPSGADIVQRPRNGGGTMVRRAANGSDAVIVRHPGDGDEIVRTAGGVRVRIPTRQDVIDARNGQTITGPPRSRSFDGNGYQRISGGPGGPSMPYQDSQYSSGHNRGTDGAIEASPIDPRYAAQNRPGPTYQMPSERLPQPLARMFTRRRNGNGHPARRPPRAAAPRPRNNGGHQMARQFSYPARGNRSQTAGIGRENPRSFDLIDGNRAGTLGDISSFKEILINVTFAGGPVVVLPGVNFWQLNDADQANVGDRYIHQISLDLTVFGGIPSGFDVTSLINFCVNATTGRIIISESRGAEFLLTQMLDTRFLQRALIIDILPPKGAFSTIKLGLVRSATNPLPAPPIGDWTVVYNFGLLWVLPEFVDGVAVPTRPPQY